MRAVADREIDANAAAWAAEILGHPLVGRLPRSTRDMLGAIRDGESRVRPADVAPVIRLVWVALDAEAIALALEVP